MKVKQHMDLQDTFGAALQGRSPEDHPEMPGIDAPWYWEYSKQNGGYTDPFPGECECVQVGAVDTDDTTGLQLHKPDMEPYNRDRAGVDRRSLKYYSALGAMPAVQEDPNMHIAAHLYASDRNSLFVMSVWAAARCWQKLIAADQTTWTSATTTAISPVCLTPLSFMPTSRNST